MRSQKAHFREVVKANEHDVLGILVDLFEWMYGLEPKLITEIIPLYEGPQNITDMVTEPLAPLDQADGQIGKELSRELLTL